MKLHDLFEVGDSHEAYGAFVRMNKHIEQLTQNPENKNNNTKAKSEWANIVTKVKSNSPSGEISDLDPTIIAKLLTSGQSIINRYKLQ